MSEVLPALDRPNIPYGNITPSAETALSRPHSVPALPARTPGFAVAAGNAAREKKTRPDIADDAAVATEHAAVVRAIGELAAELDAVQSTLDGPDATERAIKDMIREVNIKHGVMTDDGRAGRAPLWDVLTDLSELHGKDRQRRRVLSAQIKTLQRQREGLAKRMAKQTKRSA